MKSSNCEVRNQFPICIFFALIAISISLLAFPVESRTDEQCPGKLNNCTAMVRPYLRDLKYMFPTTIGDVDEMCKMWSAFVDCVRRYVSSCFSEERRSRFNHAVENSVDTVHAICSSDAVQREYLNNAECFKKVSVENCGSYYLQLIDHVSNSKAHDDHICCSYSQFKRCVHEPLLRECGHRARNLMDHSMGFLISRCQDKEELAMSEKCPSPPTSTTSFDDTTDSHGLYGNDVHGSDSRDRARADRSYSPDGYTTFAPGHITYPKPSSALMTSSHLIVTLVVSLVVMFA